MFIPTRLKLNLICYFQCSHFTRKYSGHGILFS